MSVENQIKDVEQKVEDRSLAYEILQELKESGRRWQRAFFAVLILLGLTIAGFIWFMYQYDYISEYNIEANGLYALADSNGNIVAQDIPQEQLDAFMKWWEMNGDNQKSDIKNANP